MIPKSGIFQAPVPGMVYNLSLQFQVWNTIPGCCSRYEIQFKTPIPLYDIQYSGLQQQFFGSQKCETIFSAEQTIISYSKTVLNGIDTVIGIYKNLVFTLILKYTMYIYFRNISVYSDRVYLWW